MLYYTLWMLVHLAHLVLSAITLLYEIFSGSLLCFLCVCHKSEMNFIPQPQEQKSGRRQTQCYITLCGC